MNAQLNLKEIERKAFMSMYQDGLWDIYMGLIVAGMAIFIYRPPSGYSILNIVLLFVITMVAFVLFWAAKKFITVPRMGQVTFGQTRKHRLTTMAIILGAFVLLLAGVVVLTALGWADAGEIGAFLNDKAKGIVIVAVIGAFFVGASMIVRAGFTDFPRGYYIAILMAIAVFLMISLNQPIYPVLLGVLIIIPGVVLFVRFLRKYPLHREPSHG